MTISEPAVGLIYDRVAASGVQNFNDDSEVNYESLSTDESEAKSCMLNDAIKVIANKAGELMRNG